MDISQVRAPEDLPRLFTLTLDLPEFAQAWQHCDSVANFLGKAVSGDKEDSFRYENLLSTIINEVLESLYQHHGSDAAAELSVGAEGPWLEFSIVFAPDPSALLFYESASRILASDDVSARYHQSLLDTDNSPPGLAGLLEIAASYNARIRIRKTEADDRMMVAVVLDMPRLLKE